MPDTSPILNLPYILPAQAQKHVTHNEAIQLLDMIVQLAVTSRTQTVPPATPTLADRYIVAVAATGAWAGKDNQIAVWGETGWVFVTPLAGWQAYVTAEGAEAIFDGTAWTVLGVPTQVPLLGINATADATNRLTVASAATLLNNAGAGHQVKVNKALPADTASLLFQTGFSGRAEMGLAGNDDFSVKVSADGSTFNTAMQAEAATGAVTLPQPMRLGGQAADPASPMNGTMWLNTTTGEVKLRTAGATIAVGAGGGGGGVSDGDKGDLTVSGAGTIWTIDAGAVDLSKMADLASGTIIGRVTAGTGDPEALTASQVRSMLNVANGATANSADATLLARANHTGTQAATTISGLAAVATSGSAADLGAGLLPAARFDDASHGPRAGGALHAQATVVTAGFMSGADKAKLDGVAAGATANSADATLLARANHTGTQAASTISDFAAAVAATAAVAANTAKVSNATHTGDVTGNGALTITDGAVSYAKMQDAGPNTVLARAAATAGDLGEVALAPSQLLGRGASGDVGAITLGAGLAMTGTTLSAAGGGSSTDLTYDAATRTVACSTGTDAVLPLVAPAAAGLAPASGGGTVNFLRADGTWAAPAGGVALGLGDWWQSFRIVPTITQFGVFVGAALSSGTNTSSIPSSAAFGHNPWGAFIRSSTTANSGYRYQTSILTTMFFGGGVAYKFRAKFLWRAFTNNTVRLGFHDTANSTDAQDGAYFEVIGSTIAAKTAYSNTRTQAANTYTALIDTVYTFDIDVNEDATAARLRVYEGLNANAVLDETIVTNIPNLYARAFGAGLVATNSGTVAADIGIAYELGIGTVPAFLRAIG
jgi:hypothetical protein